MCIGTPARVVAVDALGIIATIDFDGVIDEVKLILLDEPVAVGEWVLAHLGFARRKIAPDDIEATLTAWRQIRGHSPGS